MALIRFLPRKLLAVVILATAGLCVIGVELLTPQKVPHGWSHVVAARAPAAAPSALIPPIAAAPNRFLPIPPEQAEALNDERPLADRALQTAPPVTIPTAWDSMARETARRCLATAVYYEAAGEGWRGELGVAQVVLNRVRHPAYPKSICGVVYQGANLPTGCQFTFTCDGRLAQSPSPAGWKQALAVADAALSGTVEPRVGMSTHYHTRAVVPYWAPSLDKLAVLGNHIFYTLAGAAGSRRAFNGHILADTAPPGALMHAAATLVDERTGRVPGMPNPQTVIPPSPIRADAPAAVRLAADERGSLAARTGSLLQADAGHRLLRSDADGPIP
ncbi:MAG TPA: cell wall hydrolase [Novosphingobium sp.]|nr:cell wall hydrolase [Novosphingobium sp.]